MSTLKLKHKVAWRDVKWASVRKRVRRAQKRIFKASLNKNTRLVWELQRRLVCSLDAKYLSVLRVTTNKGKNTAGVDGTKTLTVRQKEKLVSTLKLDGSAKPIRRVWIPKPGKVEKRPLGIPTIRDRAKQALALLALEPQWEAQFEPNSYGFRPGRSAHDAIEAIFSNLHHGTPKWVFDADVRKCFDMIDHKKLLSKLNTFPLMERQVAAWLQSGVLEGYANSPKSVLTVSDVGTPQGGIISPLLANIALHGLEFALQEHVTTLGKPRPTANRGNVAKIKALGLVRYADDFVIIHENREILDSCMEFAEEWLDSNVGLSLNWDKSRVVNSNNSFLFLGFNIATVVKNGHLKVKITPSRASRKRLIAKVRTVLIKNRSAGTYYLISLLRPRILGWANYFRYCECKEVFHRLTHTIYLQLRAWVFRRDTRNGRRVIKERYFPTGREYSFMGKTHRDNWILVGKKGSPSGSAKHNFLPHLVWVPSQKFVKVKGAKSPYDGDEVYWTKRTLSQGSLSTRVATLLRRQEGLCTWCKAPFHTGQTWEVDHIKPRFKGGPDHYDNLQLLHRECHVQKTAQDLRNQK